MKKVLVTIMALLFGSALAAEQEYEVKFGLLEEVSSGYSLKRETTEIPYVTGKENQVFGFVIFPSGNAEYDLYSVTYLPARAKKVTGTVNAHDSDYVSEGLRSPTIRYRGYLANTMWLDNGDPSGFYLSEIYINGELVKKVSFTVGNKI